MASRLRMVERLRDGVPPILGLAAGLGLLCGVAHGDPLTSNNGLYPSAGEYSGRFIVSNLDYPETEPSERFPFGGGLGGPLTVDKAEAYMMAVKEYLGQKGFPTIVNDPENWDPVTGGWYDLVWSGAGSGAPTDPTSGREALMNTYTGQIIHASAFKEEHRPATRYVQNHAVIYYDERAAYMLGQIWKDLYDADLSAVSFPEGSIVIKAEAATPKISEWPQVLTGAATWKVFRPTTEDQAKNVTPLIPEVVEAHPLQLSVKVKDSGAAPETGWVFMAFVYDAESDGATVWDRFEPMGAMWGNDPQFNGYESGLPPGETLRETWVNPDAPAFTRDTLGWGGRMAGPNDVATRQGVITTSGKYYGDEEIGASSCLSCHSAAEFPFTANLYPSPNRSFPRDGDPFLLYEPGSEEWAEWFQNRPGNESMSGARGTFATDYDMAIMFALGATARVTGQGGLAVERFTIH